MSDSVVFFGSGPVAAAALIKLAKHTPIEAVVTKPQPAHHKTVFPVLQACSELGIGNVVTVSNKRELSEHVAERPFDSRVGVVIDFGIIISQDVIASFERGIVNSHFSLLPAWRGADPITYSVLHGDTETGVTLMLIVPALDEGPIIVQQPLALSPDITTPVLTEQLIELSDALLSGSLASYCNGDIEPVPQPTTGVSYSEKLSKADGVIDCNKSAEQLERQVRAFLEWPKSRTTLAGRDIVVTRAHIKTDATPGAPGSLWLQGNEIGIHTAAGVLVIDALIPAGKKEMTGADFIRGYQPKL